MATPAEIVARWDARKRREEAARAARTTVANDNTGDTTHDDIAGAIAAAFAPVDRADRETGGGEGRAVG